MEVDVKKHEGPKEHGQDKRQEFTGVMDGVSIAERHHDTDDDVHETEK
jgi:hypothetical protein